MPNITDILTQAQTDIPYLGFENPENVFNNIVGIQSLVELQTSFISVSKSICPDDGTTNIVTVTVLDSLKNPVSGRLIELYTKPSGNSGDGSTGITNSSGQISFNVSSMIPGFIVYSFNILS